jgi:hypothetical protein
VFVAVIDKSNGAVGQVAVSDQKPPTVPGFGSGLAIKDLTKPCNSQLIVDPTRR